MQEAFDTEEAVGEVEDGCQEFGHGKPLSNIKKLWNSEMKLVFY